MSNSGKLGPLVERVVEIFRSGDTSRVNDLFASSYLDHQGLGEPVTGPDGFRTVVHAARSSYDHLDVDIEDFIESANKVCVRLAWRGTKGMRVVERETIDILRIGDGLIVEHWGARLWIDEHDIRR